MRASSVAKGANPVALLDPLIGDPGEPDRRPVEGRQNGEGRNGVLHLRAVDLCRHVGEAVDDRLGACVGLVKASAAVPRSMAPLVRASAAQR